MALAVVSGATDAISFLSLGGAFTSVMTGNLVLLGISAGHADGGLARQIVMAVVGYIVGSAVGARIAGNPSRDDPVWPPGVARALTVEAAIFVLYAAGWWAVHTRPSGAEAAGLLGLGALALGIQSSTVRKFGVADLSTTYMTGTLTTLVIRLVSGRRLREVWRQLVLLLALLCGAALAAFLSLHAPQLVPLMQLVPLGVVLGIAGSQVRARRAEPKPDAGGRPASRPTESGGP